jgi:3-oxoacyl-[acyl-carrier protein] reductase
MDLNLKGQKVLITGTSKGIGFACAVALATEGCSLVLVGRDKGRLDKAAERLTMAPGADLVTHAADLAVGAERETVAATFHDADVLINNAGAIPSGDLAEFPMTRWDEAWQLKVLGYIHLTQLFLAHMSTRQHGTVVNVIGTAGRAPRSGYICGATGNAGLIAFTEAVGGSSLAHGVRVLGVNPGPTLTDRFREVAATTKAPADTVVEPDDLAAVVTFLCSPRAVAISGTVIDVHRGGLNR